MINQRGTLRYSRTCFLILFSFCFFFPFLCRAEGPPAVSVITTPLQKLTLIMRKSTIIEASIPIKRVSLVDEGIADAVVLTPQQIYLTGKSSGITNLTLWDEADKVIASFDLEVLPEISRLKEKLHEIFPGEEDILVTATHSSITLSGTVSSAPIHSQVLDLAQVYAPVDQEGNYHINNFLQVGGIQQVMLEVRIAEVSRVLAKRLGINFHYLSRNGRSFGVSRIGSLTSTTIGTGLTAAFETTMSDPVNIIFSFMRNGQTWTGFIDALKENSILNVLAEPTLITYSGKTATFLAGGEFPVPVPQSGGAGGGVTTITIEWKKFGVGLNFTPTILNNEKINMLIEPEVSELNFDTGVNIQGFVVPALDVTRVSTSVELGDGQSFAIAGLLKDNIAQTVIEHPLLGQVPVLGALFRSNQFIKNETELIVVVTPHLVKPIDMTKQTLPTDQYVEPNDLEFYFLGKLEGFSSPLTPGSASVPLGKNKEGGLEGNFGHIKP